MLCVLQWPPLRLSKLFFEPSDVAERNEHEHGTSYVGMEEIGCLGINTSTGGGTGSIAFAKFSSRMYERKLCTL